MPIISISFLKSELKKYENRIASEDKVVDVAVDISPLKQFIKSLSAEGKDEKDRELTSAEQLTLAEIVLKHPLKKDHLFFNIGQKFKTPLFLDSRISYNLITDNLFTHNEEIDWDGLALYPAELKLQKNCNKANMNILKKHFEAYQSLSLNRKLIILRYIQVCILSNEDELLTVLNHIETVECAFDVLNKHKLEGDKYLLALQKNIAHADDMAYVLVHLDEMELIPKFYNLVCLYAEVIDVISKARKKMTSKVGLLAAQEDWIDLFPLLCEGATVDGFLGKLTALADAQALNRESFIILVNEVKKECKIAFLLGMGSNAGAKSPVRIALLGSTLYDQNIVKLIWDWTFFGPKKPKLTTEIEEDKIEKKQRINKTFCGI